MGASWADWKSEKKKSLKYRFLLFYTTIKKHFLIVTCYEKWILCDKTMTSSVVGLRRWSKALPKVKFAPKKGQGHCLVFCCGSDPLQLSESWQTHYNWETYSVKWLNALKNFSACSQYWSTIRAQFFSVTTHHTTITSKVEQIGQWSFASSAIFAGPLINWLPLLQHLDFLQGKCFHSQQDAESAFQEFVESQSMKFYTTGKNKLIPC